MIRNILAVCLLALGLVHGAPASEKNYGMYNDEGESIGSIRSTYSPHPQGEMVETRFSMQGEFMFIHFSMQGEDRVVLDEQGIRHFEIYDEIEAPLMSTVRFTRGDVQDDKLVLLVKEKDKEPVTETIPLSEFDTISRINFRDMAGFARLLRSAPVTLRSLNLMERGINEVTISREANEEQQINGKMVVLEKYRMSHPQGDSLFWLLPDGRVYRQLGPFGTILLDTGDEPELGW